ncbi:MAG TPA: phage tail protein [Gammaproteobacteria bacterium]|nr:phage tail protein [Gammaproteobacteria bacterium]
MSGLFGAGPKPQAAQDQRANGLQVQSSAYGKVLTIVYGRARLPGNLMWYGDFRAIPHKQEAAGSGKGGGGGGNATTTYTYSASFALALCEGEIAGLGRIWRDSGSSDAAQLSATVFKGSVGQAPWSKWSGDAALNYPYVAYVGFGDADLGSSASLPNLNFEVFGLLPFSADIQDCEPSAVITDALTSPTHGLGFDYLGDLSLYRSYCVANGLFLSPTLDTERSMADQIGDLLTLTNSAPVWSGGELKIIPYGDENVVGNGAQYVPPIEVCYDLTDDDFQDADEPVHIERKPLADRSNAVRIEMLDAAKNYVQTVVEAKDQSDIDARGVRNLQTITAHAIKDPTIGRGIAQRILQRQLYIRTEYTFSLPLNYSRLEQMDVVTLTSRSVGLDHEPVRITQIDESDDGMTLDVTAEEFAAGVFEGALYATEPHAGAIIDTNVAPDATQVPIFIRAPQFLVDTPEIWIGAAGAGPNWGGAHVWISYDEATYEYLTTVYPGARYGTLAADLPVGADPDTADTLTVGLYAGELAGATQAAADKFATMALVDHELIAYAAATLNAGGEYDLTYLRRGGYGTAIAAHAAGAPFLRVDENLVRVPFDPGQVGDTIYIKFTAFNLYGAAEEDIAAAEVYSYVIGQGEEVPDVPPVPTEFNALPIADGVHITWENPNPAAVLNTYIEYSTDDVNWGTLRIVGGATEYFDHHFDDGAHFYYRAWCESHSHQASDYTPVVDSTGKTVVDGADVTAEEAIPNGISVGGILYADITINSDSTPNPGEIWYGGAAFKFVHPSGASFDVPANAITNTQLEGPDAKHGWLAFVGADTSRFSMGAPYNAFVLVKKTGTQWYYDDNANWQPFTPIADDCIVAALEHDAGDAAGISQIHRFAVRYATYADGSDIDGLKPSEKDADKTSDHAAGGVGIPAINFPMCQNPDFWIVKLGGHMYKQYRGTSGGGDCQPTTSAGNLHVTVGDDSDVHLRWDSPDGTFVKHGASGGTFGPWYKQFDQARLPTLNGEVLDATADYIAPTTGRSFIHPGYVGAAFRPFKLNRSGGIDLAADDISLHGEVYSHIGGLNNPYVSLDDQVQDGTSYARTLASRLAAGKPWIDFAENIHANKTADYIAESTLRKWAAESGANVSHSATVIHAGTCTGDGTQNGYDYRTLHEAHDQGLETNSTLEYDIWIDEDSVDNNYGIDIGFSDGDKLRNHVITFGNGHSDGKWRSVSIPLASVYGKVCRYYASVWESDVPGFHHAQIRNVRLTHNDGSTMMMIYGSGTTVPGGVESNVGGSSFYSQVGFCTAAAGMLTSPGSGATLGDERNARTLIGWNRTNGGPEDAILSAADVGSSTTITIRGHTRYGGFGNTAFPAGSLTGAGFGEYRAVYMDSDYSVNGSYASSTSSYAPLQNSDRVYLGDLTTPPNGGGSTGGGGYPCLPATELADLGPRGSRPCMDNTGHFIGERAVIHDFGTALAECVLLITEDGYGLPMSVGTPNLCGDGRERYAPAMAGHLTACTIAGVNCWRRVVAVMPLGVQRVVHRSFGGVSFSAPAWDLRGWRRWWWRLTGRPWRRSSQYDIFSHNMKA